MKKLVFTFMLSCLSTIYATGLPTTANINLTLANIERGDSCPAILLNAKVEVDYDYNFERNMGQAHLKQLQNSNWVETLFPLGLSSYYAFMSDMSPKVIQLDNGEVTIFRVIFHLYKNGDTKLYLMINQEGDCIMSTDVVNVNPIHQFSNFSL